MTTRAKNAERSTYTPVTESIERSTDTAPEQREPLADARIRPLLERYVATAGAQLIDVGEGLVELHVPRGDRKAFRDRAQIRIAFTLDALEQDPEAEIAVVGSALVEQLISAIRSRGSRASYGRVPSDLTPSEEAAAFRVPITNGTASTPTVNVARHRVVRLLARVVVQAGSAIEEHLLESGFFDAATGVAVPADVADRCRNAMLGESSPAEPESGKSVARLIRSRPSADLVALALADLRGSLEPKVRQLRSESDRALQAELLRIDGYYASLLSDGAGRNTETPDDAARRVIELEHQRRRAEEERRHQVRAVVHPVQITEWELLVQRAEWELRDQKGTVASLVSERWLNGAGNWILPCPECGTESPETFSVCKSGQVACNACAMTCGVCAEVFCRGDGLATCHVDGQPTCADHARSCACCERPCCTAHEIRCAEGDHAVCSACVEACAICGRSVCDEHAMLSSKSSPRGARRLCGQCSRSCEGGTNERVGMDEVTRCSSCEKFVCEQHRSTCAVDGSAHCSKHLRRTDSSRRLVCESHRTQCAFEAGAIHASDEVESCNACGKNACHRHSHLCVEDGQRYCDSDVVMLRNELGTFACREHHAICHVDHGAYRIGQTTDCPVCGKPACKSHLRNCGWCGRAVCVTDLHGPTGRCQTCRALRETTDPSDSVLSAVMAMLGSRTVPKRWKLARDGAHTVVEVDLGWTRRAVFVVPHGDDAASSGRTHSAVRSRAIDPRS